MPFIFVFVALLVASPIWGSDIEIIGKWRGQNPEDGIMIFNKNGKFDVVDQDGNSAFSHNPQPVITWEAITEIEPHQLYIHISYDNKIRRTPLGIYKIVKDKLILRPPKTYHRTFGGFDMGVSRYEIPKDFSGVINVFKKIK